ncbi:A/G-specific adenine glycosylase [Saonia flava]|uniref:Adenine DNA glycosylase n=1 Tax=Saonia flava TaxID=523696 RepID=A0A846QY95_9FLAO|nr:A/G-specific adenine glycosylase [Saonia flava]NJB71193.1 A/G-specific adenine glycosylase [Saonia flava]
MSFSEKIIAWYLLNKRDLPWRNTRNPYNIWLSEIMLQQTRIAQGTPYYHKFIDNFPTVEDLANANEQEVLKLWQGLGYYSRARNLHATAKKVVNDFDGEFPTTYKGLIKLRGVGDYTASAIASFCFNEPEPVLDGNVFRVLARYFGVAIPINSSKGSKYFKELAKEVMNIGNIRDYNQGIMEFGSIQCAPKNPKCSNCPLNDGCIALKEDKVHQLPVKLKKTKVKARYFNYLVLMDDDSSTSFIKRTGKGIWQNLFEFPLLETEKEINLEDLKNEISKVVELDEVSNIYLYNEQPIIHKLSHQHLHTKFWILKTHAKIKEGIEFSKLDKYPAPVLIADFIKAFKI